MGIGNDNLADDVRDLSTSGNHGDIKGDADVVSHDGSTFVEFDDREISSSFELHQNYPNPFNPFTKIQFNIPRPGYVIIRIYDIRGREIETIVNSYMAEGPHEINWFSKGLPSGIYFCRIETKGYIKTMKMVLEK